MSHVTTTGRALFSDGLPSERAPGDVTLGRYGPDGLSLARAREKCIDARRAIAEGRSPAHEKQREKRRLKEAKSFGEFGEKWLPRRRMADSTRAMRRSIFEREHPSGLAQPAADGNPAGRSARALREGDDRGAPATAIHVRDIVKQIFGFRDPAWREGRQPRRRSWPGVDRDLRAEGPVAVSRGDPGHAQLARACADAADHPARDAVLPAVDGPQERIAGRDLG